MTGTLRVIFLILAMMTGAQEAPVTLEHILTLPTDQTILGFIADVDVLPNGNILALDSQANQIFVFDQTGGLVRTLAREGQGPGEVRGASDIEVSRDGMVWLVDFGNSRITRWNSSGDLEGSYLLGELLGQPIGWPHELVVNDGGVFLKTSQFMPEEPVRIFRLREDLSGVLDTIASVVPGPGASTCVFCPTTVGPTGRPFAAQGDTVYAVSEIGGSGEQVSFLRREGIPAVLRSEDELAQLRAAARRLPIPEGVEVPEPNFSRYKTRFGKRSIEVDDHGRIWVAPRAQEGKATVFDLFGSSGEYLGSSNADASLNGFRIRGDRLIAISETAIGEPVVRVYEIR